MAGEIRNIQIAIDKDLFVLYRMAEARKNYPLLADAGGLSDRQARASLEAFMESHVAAMVAEYAKGAK